MTDRKPNIEESKQAGYSFTLSRNIIFKIYAPELTTGFEFDEAGGANYFAYGTISSAAHHLEHGLRECHKGIPKVVEGADNMLFMKFGEMMEKGFALLKRLREIEGTGSGYDFVGIAWGIADVHNMARRLNHQAGYEDIDPETDWDGLGAGPGGR